MTIYYFWSAAQLMTRSVCSNLHLFVYDNWDILFIWAYSEADHEATSCPYKQKPDFLADLCVIELKRHYFSDNADLHHAPGVSLPKKAVPRIICINWLCLPSAKDFWCQAHKVKRYALFRSPPYKSSWNEEPIWIFIQRLFPNRKCTRICTWNLFLRQILP